MNLCSSIIPSCSVPSGTLLRPAVWIAAPRPGRSKWVIPLGVLFAVVGTLCLGGCSSTKKSGDVTALRSEREYGERIEAQAQELYKTGQASSLAEARAQAATTANQEWARAAKAAERKQKQDKFENDLAKMDSKGK